jgi:hypothetical protein
MHKEAKNVNFISHGSEMSKYEAKRKVKEAKQSEKNGNLISLLLDAIFHRPSPQTAQRYHNTCVVQKRKIMNIVFSMGQTARFTAIFNSQKCLPRPVLNQLCILGRPLIRNTKNTFIAFQQTKILLSLFYFPSVLAHCSSVYSKFGIV